MAVHEDGVTCTDCWGIVPEDGISYVKEDGELCICPENQFPGSYDIKAVDPKSDGAVVCGCGRAWAEDITPAGRCPWESLHVENDGIDEDGQIVDKHLIIDIQMSNSEVQTGEDLAEILRGVIADIEQNDTGRDIRDINGHKVGTWSFKQVAR